MLSVLHVMSRMSPSGTELQLAGMLRAAREHHWRPTLCVLYPGFELTAQVRLDRIDVVELDGDSRIHRDRFQALRRLATKSHFDVVHTSLWGAGAFGRAALIGSNRPAIVMSERRVEEFRPSRRRAVDVALARITDEWIGNSADVCDFVVRAHRAPRERVHVIPNGVDTDVFRPAVTPRAPRDRQRIGALGRLTHQKGFDVLLDALPRVLDERAVEVVIVGEGEQRGELERRAAGLPVSLPGARAGGPDVAEYLRSLDVFVMPSRYEGLPNAVLEAVACGLPVVATDVAGMRAAVGPGVELVPAADPAALATALLGALDSPRVIAAASTRSFDDVARDHLRVFEAAVEHRNGRRRSRRAAPIPS